MITKKLNSKDNELELLYDLCYEEEQWIFYDWSSKKVYYFDKADECFSVLKSILSPKIYELFLNYRECISEGSPFGIDREFIAEIDRYLKLTKEYEMLVNRLPEEIKMLVERYEINIKYARHNSPSLIFFKNRYLRFFDDRFEENKSDDTRNYFVYNYHTDDGHVFYIHFGNTVPHLEEKHSMQKDYWNGLLQKKTVSYSIEYEKLTKKEAQIICEALKLKYSDEGEFVFGSVAQEYRYAKNSNYITDRTVDHVFFDDYYRVFFPETVTEKYPFDAPSIESLSIVAFSEYRQNCEMIREWVLTSNGAIRTKLGKTTKCFIVSEEYIKLQDYFRARSYGCKICLIEDVIAYIKSLKTTVNYKIKVKVPKYDKSKRKYARELIKNSDVQIEELLKLQSWQLQNKKAECVDVYQELIVLIAYDKKDNGKISDLFWVYMRLGMFCEALDLIEDGLERNIISINQQDRWRFEMEQLKKIIAVDTLD